MISELRQQLTELSRKQGFRLCMPELWLCTDNAAPIAAAAYWRYVAGERSTLDLEAAPSLRLA